MAKVVHGHLVSSDEEEVGWVSENRLDTPNGASLIRNIDDISVARAGRAETGPIAARHLAGAAAVP